jgi:hypothetical protein
MPATRRPIRHVEALVRSARRSTSAFQATSSVSAGHRSPGAGDYAGAEKPGGPGVDVTAAFASGYRTDLGRDLSRERGRLAGPG